MMKTIQMKKEFKNKLPFIARCLLARYGTMDIDEFQNISGMTDDADRSTLRRVYNELVKKGFATKSKKGRESIYESVKENESDSVKKFAKADETYFFDMDMYEFLASIGISEIN